MPEALTHRTVPTRPALPEHGPQSLLVSSIQPLRLRPLVVRVPRNEAELLALPIAQLQGLGLQVREINNLEATFDAIYLGDLPTDAETVLAMPYFGLVGWRQLQQALDRLRRAMRALADGGPRELVFDPYKLLAEEDHHGAA